MKISEEQVRYVADLARLELEAGERVRFTSQLNAVLEYMEQLGELDTEGVEPTSHVIPIENVFRDDEAGHSLGSEEALSNAPRSEKGHFAVPKIIE